MGLVGLLIAAIRIYTLIIIARVIFSYVPERHRQNEIYAFVVRITDPVLGPVRRALPSTGGIDFSPLLVILALVVIRRILLQSAL